MQGSHHPAPVPLPHSAAWDIPCPRSFPCPSVCVHTRLRVLSFLFCLCCHTCEPVSALRRTGECVCLCTSPHGNPPVCVPGVHAAVCPCICCTCLSVCLSVCTSLCVCAPVPFSLSDCVSVCLCVPVSTCVRWSAHACTCAPVPFPVCLRSCVHASQPAGGVCLGVCAASAVHPVPLHPKVCSAPAPSSGWLGTPPAAPHLV